ARLARLGGTQSTSPVCLGVPRALQRCPLRGLARDVAEARPNRPRQRADELPLRAASDGGRHAPPLRAGYRRALLATPGPRSPHTEHGPGGAAGSHRLEQLAFATLNDRSGVDGRAWRSSVPLFLLWRDG